MDQAVVHGCTWRLNLWQHAAGYSLWTNRSFKTPLLAAALVCIFGNVLYAVGYDVKTLWILLASRLLVGFGKPMQLVLGVYLEQTLAVCLPHCHRSVARHTAVTIPCLEQTHLHSPLKLQGPFHIEQIGWSLHWLQFGAAIRRLLCFWLTLS